MTTYKKRLDAATYWVYDGDTLLGSVRRYYPSTTLRCGGRVVHAPRWEARAEGRLLTTRRTRKDAAEALLVAARARAEDPMVAWVARVLND